MALPSLLLTNDDGFDAAGLAALHRAVGDLGRATIVAPACCHSGCSHRVTTDQAFRVLDRGAGQFVVEGTPADCVRVGLHELAPDSTWVLAGINHGGNLGADVHLSGTVAAVREGVLLGRAGIAFSHYRRAGSDFDWTRAVRWVTPVVRDLLARPIVPGTFWNVNLPHLAPGESDPDVVFCPLDPSPLHMHYERQGDMWKYAGDYHARPRQAGTDIDVCFGGRIAVTRLSLAHDAAWLD